MKDIAIRQSQVTPKPERSNDPRLFEDESVNELERTLSVCLQKLFLVCLFVVFIAVMVALTGIVVKATYTVAIDGYRDIEQASIARQRQ